MKTPPEDHDLHRWLDGAMNAAEKAAFEARMATDPALKDEAMLLQRLSADLRTHLPAELPVPYADFFNSQIQVRLAQEENQRTGSVARGGLFSWLRLPWLAPAALAAALVVAGVSLFQGHRSSESLVHSIYVPNAAIQARSFHSHEAQATVLVLEGLEDMPADRNIVSFSLTRVEMDTATAATTFFDAHGSAVAVLATDAHSQPRVLTAATSRR
jgi:anti-sigma-K factor RskA